MRKKLHYASKFTGALKQTHLIAQDLDKQYGGKFVHLPLPQSKRAQEFMNLLDSPTFTQDSNDTLAYFGKVKLAYKRMAQCKHELKPAYAGIAELDFLMSSTRLMKEAALSPLSRPYCVASFEESEPTVL